MNTHDHSDDHKSHAGADSAPRDPVCGMTPKPDTPHRLMHAGQEVLFCSAGCKAKFEADPTKYTKPAEEHAYCAQPAVASAGASCHGHGHRVHGAPSVDLNTVPAGSKWTCPMHPEIVRAGPGSCPICGMALEPMMPSADAGPNPELIDMTRRFWIGAALALPVLALEMGRHFLG
ncbi:MAG: YHS domain-containing protein, partial [Hyphomonadaceae bacterium]|nr:YHS domain-containing protein [Hyphomonadaceae bacterium]